MMPVLRLELRRRWKSPAAWLFLALQLAVCGAMVLIHNLSGGEVGLEPAIRWSLRSLLLTCPVLCWGVYTSDLREDAWKRMLSLGIGPFRLALSRLLSAWSVCLAMALVSFGEMAAFSAVSPVRLATALCGGAAILAEACLLSGFCLWVESRSKKAWKAALGSALTLLGLYALGRAGALIEAKSAHNIFSAISLALCRTAEYLLSLSRMEWLVSGLFRVEIAASCLLGGLAFGCLAAARLMLRKSPRRQKRALAVAAVALAAWVALDYGATLGPLGSFPGIGDATRIRAVTPTEEAEAIVKEAADQLGEIRAIYFSSREDTWIEALLANYERLDARFTGYRSAPSEATNLQANQVAPVDLDEDGYLVVAGGNRMAVIPADRLYAYSYAYNPSTQAYQATDIRFAAQKELLSALKLLSGENAPCLWALSSPDGSLGEMGGDAWQLASDNGMYVQKVYSIPEKAENRPECIYLNPTYRDLTDQERDDLLTYLKAGGGLIVTTNYQYGDFPNLFSVLEYCGMRPWGRVAVETKTGLYMDGYPYYPAPVAAEHDVTRFVAGNQVLVPTAHAIQAVPDLREGLTVTPLLQTSADSYLKTNPSAASMEREDGDESGPLTLAMAAGDGTMRALWVSGSDFMADNMASLSPANMYFWLGAVQWASGGELGAAAVDVEAPSLAAPRVSLAPARALPVAAAALIPALAALIVWAVLSVRRRKNAAKARG